MATVSPIENKITTIGALLCLSEIQILSMRDVRTKHLQEIKQKLALQDLRLWKK